MKVCPRCKFYNQDKNKRCLKCGWTLEPTKDLPETPTRLRSDPLEKPARKIYGLFRDLFSFLRSEIPEAPYRFPYLAAGLSLLFGAGQVYNRQYKKALLFCLAHIACLVIVATTITDPRSNLIILGYVAFLLFVYNDGLVTALRINGQQWTVRYTIAAYSALFFILGIGITLGQFFVFSIFKLILVTQDTIEPVLCEWDLVYVDCMYYKFASPKRGDIVFYTPEPFHIEVHGGMESTRYYVQERRTFERVMGLPHDVVERKEGKFLLNGRPMTPWCQPLLPDNIHANMRFVVPGDRYLVIFSHSPKELGIGSIGGNAPPLNAPGVTLDGWDKACLVRKKQIIGRSIFIMNPPTHRRFLLPP